MQDKEKRWRELAALAAIEQDPKKLMALIKEITEILNAKPDGLTHLSKTSKSVE
ncbi:MAG TPA: hypothetical protein VGF44_13690 [Terriglobales bacterium]|jgi:hypothetical protein